MASFEAEDAELVLDAELQAQAEAEIGEPCTIEEKRARLSELRNKIAELPVDDRIKDTSADNLVRFLRSSKYRLPKALERTVDYARFFSRNRDDLSNVNPSEEFAVLKDLVVVYRDLPGVAGRVVVCLFPKKAAPLIPAETLKSNPRILLRFNVWMFERLSRDRQVQVRGLILLNSFADAGLSPGISISSLVNMSERRLAFSFFSIMGFRLHCAMVFEEPTFLTWFWWAIKVFVSAKIRDRFMLNGTNYAKVDEVLGPEVRQRLPEPFKSLGKVGFGSPLESSQPSWVLEQLSLMAATEGK